MEKLEIKDQVRTSRILRQLTLTGIFAALYGALVIIFAQTSVLPFQIRFADALMPLAILFGLPGIAGLGLGALLGNLGADAQVASQFGLSGSFIGIDMVFGSITNIIAGTLAWRLGTLTGNRIGRNRSWFIGVVVEALVIALSVGSYLFLLLGIPAEIAILGLDISGLVASVLGVFFGSIIAVIVLGFPLLLGLGRSQTVKSFRSSGLKVYASDQA